MSAEAFVSGLLKNFGQAIQPLIDAVAPLGGVPPSTGGMSALLAEFGWTLDPNADPAAMQGVFTNIVRDLNAIVADATRLNPHSSQSDINRVTADLAALLADIGNLASAGSGLTFSPFNQQEFWSGPQSFPVLLWPYLVHRYLRSQVSILYGALRFLGILTETSHSAADSGRGGYIERKIHWERIPRYASQPGSTFAGVYHWGDSATPLDHVALIQGMGALAGTFPIASVVDAPSEEVQDIFYPAGAPPNLLQLSTSPIPSLDIDGPIQILLKLILGVIPVPVAGGTPSDPVGIALFPVLDGEAAAQFQVTETFAITVEGHFQSIPVIVEFRPVSGGGISAKMSQVTLDALASQTQIAGSVTLSAKAPAAAPWIPLGVASSNRLELAGAHLAVRAAGPLDKLDYEVEVGFDGAKLVLDLSDSDGFLQNLMGSGPQGIDLSCAVKWSRKTGFSFNGQSSVSASIPVHKTLANVLNVDTISLAMGAGSGSDTAMLSIAASGSLVLGPIAASVEKVGAQLQFKNDPSHHGNLGDFDLRFSFQPPSGIGLVIDAPSVTGGGYLFFDFQKEQYTGILQLEIAETIAVKAIGLLTTRMPDGSKGFSLLVIITVEGFTPIQLGFGFTLTGIGGLLGVNRTAAVDALRSGIKAGTLGSILFPVDPVRNAPRIVSDVGTVFPVALNRYVFGPMVMINWGTPTILTLELGLVLEVPDPVRLFILGRLQATLPEAKNALAQIRMDSLGVVDFGKAEVSLDATLYDSKILSFALTGDMALRANFGSNPGFLLAIGGWNPRFPSPAGFPRLSRMAITLSSIDNARLRLESYLAITSNTVQFGARADFFFGAGPFGVEGYLGFDALFHFAPFSFTADLSASVALRAGSTILMSVGLTMTLTGPSPWHVWGTASFTILFVKQSVTFNATYGSDPLPVLPDPVDVKSLLIAALNDTRNWSSELPANARPLVTFRPAAGATGVLRVHPLAELAVRERVVPLDMAINRFGNAPVSGDNLFSLKAVRSDTGGEIPSQSISDAFALAQFLEMSDDQKLSAPAFTSKHAGIRFTTGDFAYGYEPSLDTAITYETVTIVPGQAAAQQLRTFFMSATAMEGTIPLAAAAQAIKQQTAASRRGIRTR
jgi:Family of unknown function (DUF6603)